MTALRAFFGLFPDEETKGRLAFLLKNLKESSSNIKFSMIENLHITLQFIAHFEKADLTPLIAKVRQLLSDWPPFYLELGNVEWFPSEKEPKILSLSVKAQENLTALSLQLGLCLQDFNYPIETRPYRPHLTIGRLRGKETIIHLKQQETLCFTPLLINKVYLMESKPSHQQSDYYPLAVFNLSI